MTHPGFHGGTRTKEGAVAEEGKVRGRLQRRRLPRSDRDRRVKHQHRRAVEQRQRVAERGRNAWGCWQSWQRHINPYPGEGLDVSQSFSKFGNVSLRLHFPLEPGAGVGPVAVGFSGQTWAETSTALAGRVISCLPEERTSPLCSTGSTRKSGVPNRLKGRGV